MTHCHNKLTSCHYYSISYGGYGAAMMQKRIKNRLEREKNAQDPRQELKNYLDSSLEDTSDQIKWWGVSYSFI